MKWEEIGIGAACREFPEPPVVPPCLRGEREITSPEGRNGEAGLQSGFQISRLGCPVAFFRL